MAEAPNIPDELETRALSGHTGEGRYPAHEERRVAALHFSDWAPAFAGVTAVEGSAL